jgi:hypothetical protein
MKKGIGIFLTLIGLVATVVTGMNALDQSDSFSVLGVDVVVSQADYTPVIISAVVLIIGIILWTGSKK